MPRIWITSLALGLAVVGCASAPKAPEPDPRGPLLYVSLDKAASEWGLAVSRDEGDSRIVLKNLDNHIVLAAGLDEVLVNGDWIDARDQVIETPKGVLIPVSTLGQIKPRVRGIRSTTGVAVARAPSPPKAASQPLVLVASTPAKPSNFQAKLPEGTLPKSGRAWKYIVIHHSDTESGSAAVFHRYHLEQRKWKNGLGYHFVIGNGHGAKNGEIEIGGRWKSQIQGAHAGSDLYNEQGIGICLVGNFTDKGPGDPQTVALRELCRALMRRFDIPAKNVIGHSDVPGKHTDCPGKGFSIDIFRRSL